MSDAADNLRAIPRGVWALGFVSMFMDVSSEMVHSLLPVFLVAALGASTTTVGVIEGVAEATASIAKMFSGTLSDWLGRRKILAVIGYGIAALAKPLFPLATTAGWVLTARFMDRIGKGVRDAPRDALLGSIAPPELRGACYGLRQSMDTIGAVAGPLLAAALMALSADDYRLVFWVAVAPALVAVAVLVLGVAEPDAESGAEPGAEPGAGRTADEAPALIHAADLRRLGAPYWWLAAISAISSLARFSDAFLVLRATGLGLAVALAPLVFVAINVVYAMSAYPAGVLSDRLNRWGLLAVGFAVLIAADLVLAFSPGIGAAAVGVCLWGLHLGLTQGIVAALVADSTPEELRGTAFGVFHLAGGIAALLASVIAGVLWTALGAPAAFLAGAGLALLALAGAATLSRRGDLRGAISRGPVSRRPVSRRPVSRRPVNRGRGGP